MNKTDPISWNEKDTDCVLKSVSQATKKALEQRIPKTLIDNQSEKLREIISESLAREASLSIERIVERFIEEEKKVKQKEKKRQILEKDFIERLSLHLRIQHMILFTSTILLIVTGLPIKFHEAGIAQFIINIFGGAEVTRILHRIGAIGLTFIGFYHIWYTMAFSEGRRDFGYLMPKIKDIKDFIHQIGYFLGIKGKKPLFDRFSYIEKFDYWAVYWGMIVMITSGYIMWFKDLVINEFGKPIFDISREAHSDEALLATLAIIIWHFYNVHFNPHKFPGSLTWWNGKISIDEFKREHPLEYEEWLLSRKNNGLKR